MSTTETVVHVARNVARNVAREEYSTG